MANFVDTYEKDVCWVSGVAGSQVLMKLMEVSVLLREARKDEDAKS